MITPDLELVGRDRRLAGLRRLLSAEEFAALLRDGLVNHSSLASEISHCEPLYIRYKPGVNCVALFRAHPVDGQPFLSYGRVSAGGTRTTRGYPRSISVVENSESQIALYVFPGDRRLRVLPRLFDGAAAEQLWAGVPQTLVDTDQEVTVRSIGYKPERRFVGALEQDGVPVAAVKVQTARAFSHAWKAANAFSEDRELLLARPVASRRRHGLSVLPWKPGTLVSDLTRSGKAAAVDIAVCGAALARIHAQHIVGLPLNAHDDLLRHARAALDAIVWVRPDCALRADNVIRRAQRVIGEFDDGDGPDFVASHGDYYAKQILLQGDRAVVLDFDRSALAHPAWDLGMFAAHLVYDAVRGYHASDRVPAFIGALMDGYRSAGGRVSRQAVDAYTALALASLAPHPFRFRCSDWTDQLDQLLSAADDALLPHYAGQTLLSSVPADMPWLAQALDKRSAGDRLTTTLGSPVSVRSASIVRHKPGRRATLKYEVAASDGRQFLIFGKARANTTDTATHLLTQDLTGALVGATSLRLADPIGVIEAWNMVLQQGLEGTPLSDLPVGAELATRVVRATSELHLSNVFPPRQWTWKDEVAQLEQLFDRVADEHPAWEPRLAELLGWARTAAAAVPTTEECVLHRDLHPGNILLEPDGRIGFIDLDLVARGPAAIDLGNFTAHLIEECVREERPAVEVTSALSAVSAEVVRCYGEAVLAEVQLATRLTLMRHIYISMRYPPRRRWTHAILALCERSRHTLEAHDISHTISQPHLTTVTI